jgi:type I restriction enzyme S subunit
LVPAGEWPLIKTPKPYPAIKDSGIPWLGTVPEHWMILPALAVYRPRQVKNIGMMETTVLSLSYGQLIVKAPDKLHGLVPESFETYQVVDPGNIIVRTTDLQNDQTSLRVAHSRHRGIITSAYMCLETTQRVSNQYGYQYLNAYDLLKIIYGFGSGLRQNLDFSDIKRMPVLVPPRDEQAAIVRFLDHADRKIRRYIRAKQKLIKLLEEQKQSIIHSALTRGLDPHVRLKPSGLEWLGDVPEHWEIRRAKAVCSAIVDCKNRTPDAIEGGGFLVVRTTCVRAGKFDASGGYTTDAANFRIWTSRGAPQLGDVFFTREAPAGEACLVPDQADLCMGQRMMYFRPDPDLLDPEFLLLNIYGPLTQTYIELETNGSTVGHLRLGQVYSLPLVWCPIEEQRAIVAHVHATSQGLEQAQASAKQEIVLLQEYRTRLIADVVTGKLDVREAAAGLPDEALEEEYASDEMGEDLEAGEGENDLDDDANA